jgi:mRNA interferase MazF
MYSKHKDKNFNELTDAEIDSMFSNFRNKFKDLHPKQQNILRDWFGIWGQYISFEYTFDPKKNGYYKRGDIVFAHFGYNIGSELGGKHYAVVVENDNNNASKTVVVVPISSIDNNREKPLHSSEVYLGEVIPGSKVKSYAMPMQIRAISKLRIIKSKTLKKYGKIAITSKQLSEIDKKIINLYTKNLDIKY